VNIRRVGAVVVLVAIGTGIGIGLATAFRDDDGGSGDSGDDATPRTTLAIERPDAAENPEAAELFDLVTAFPALTLHAKYKVTVAGGASATEVEIWQKGGKVRQDASLAQQGRVTIINLGDQVVLCQQPPNGKYTCGEVPETQQTAFESLRTNLLAGLAEQKVTVRDAEVGGRDVRCFTVEAANTSELCITSDGVLARITAPQGSFELLEAENTVDDSVFEPPAPPGPAPPGTGTGA
jgi:hypothetical protein